MVSHTITRHQRCWSFSFFLFNSFGVRIRTQRCWPLAHVNFFYSFGVLAHVIFVGGLYQLQDPSKPTTYLHLFGTYRNNLSVKSLGLNSKKISVYFSTSRHMLSRNKNIQVVLLCFSSLKYITTLGAIIYSI